MKSKIIFQRCNFNYIYFLFYIIIYIILLIIEAFLFQEELKSLFSNKYFLTSKQMLEIFISNLSDFFAIIPYYIRKKRIRKNNDNKEEEKDIDNKNNENKEKVELIYNESKQSATNLKQKEIIFYLILIAAFDFLKDFPVFIYYLIKGEEYERIPFNFIIVFDIILQFILSCLILRVHFYKLQYFSLVLNFIILIIVLTLDLVDILVKINNRKKIKGDILMYVYSFTFLYNFL